jgi:hypothetical protein
MILPATEKLAAKSEMLAPGVTTQRNEAFNALMSQVAPKSVNFNLSCIIKMKVDSAVVQFNCGARFPELIFASARVSPDRTGYHDATHVSILNLELILLVFIIIIIQGTFE